MGRETMPAFNEVFACGDWEEVVDDEKENDDTETLSTGWIVSIVALVLAAAFLLCFVIKSFKVQALEQEIKDIAQMNRSRVNSEKRRESVDVTDAVNGCRHLKVPWKWAICRKFESLFIFLFLSTCCFSSFFSDFSSFISLHICQCNVYF